MLIRALRETAWVFAIFQEGVSSSSRVFFEAAEK